jgi:acyl carrier protein
MSESTNGQGKDKDEGRVEERLRQIWMSLTQAPEVSGDSDFFELGGTSMSLFTLSWTLKEDLGIDVRARDLWLARRFDSMCKVVRDAESKMGRSI